MKTADLGFMKIPLSGDFNHILLCGGIAWGLIVVTVVTALSGKKGPAVDQTTGHELTDACSNSILVTSLWCVLYMNYIGIQVMAIFMKGVWEMITDQDVTEKFAPNASRFAGNTLEQFPIFLPALWMYTLFCDSNTGANLGFLYLFSRAMYPLFYIANGKFTFWFEFCTQIGYGVNGVLVLGSLFQSLGGDWIGFLRDAPIVAPILGFLFGTLAMVPGLPLGPLYAYIHYKVDHARALKAVQKLDG